MTYQRNETPEPVMAVGIAPITMTRDEWITRYIAKMKSMVPGEYESWYSACAEASAEVTYDMDPTESPEDAVAEELSCWTDDE